VPSRPFDIEGFAVSLPPLDAAVGVAYHLVTGLAVGVAPVFGGAATATAIVLATLVVRLLLVPLRVRQMRAQRAAAALAPRVAELRARHGRDPGRLARELAELYRSERTGPFAGLLPALAQAPFFLVLYRLLNTATIDGTPNRLLHHTLLGVPLGAHWTSGPAVFLAIAGLLVLLGWWAAHRLGPDVPGPVRLLSYASAAALLVLPLAAGLYLLTSAAWTALETAVGTPPGPG
jgi:YidC/Oxa1 family membrane protein insertase